MIPWTLLDSTQVPGRGGTLGLYQRGDELSIRIIGEGGLMNSRLHDSEDALAELSCRKLADTRSPRLLIGGLGMGFTLAAALRNSGEDAQVVVAELVPVVVEWNRGVIGKLTGNPLNDSRVSVLEADVSDIIKSKKQHFDAIILDVDNGPDGLTLQSNDWLYSLDGLSAAYAALRPSGVLAVWSAGPDREFTQRLRKTGFAVEEVQVRSRGSKGAIHTIWLAVRDA